MVDSFFFLFLSTLWLPELISSQNFRVPLWGLQRVWAKPRKKKNKKKLHIKTMAD